MPLPEGKQLNEPWPPEPYGNIAGAAFEEIQAWWTGTPESLDGFYRGHNLGQARGPVVKAWQYNGGFAGWAARKFWGDPPPVNSRQTRLHLPLAADIIETSSTLLFGEPIAFAFPGKKVTAADGTVSTKDTQSSQTSSRLDKVMNNEEMHSSLLLGGQLQAAFGGVYGRIVVDKEVSDVPFFDFVDADRAVPEFRWGRLVAVTFWTLLAHDDSKGGWWRHLERHEPGKVLHGLYRGEKDRLGRLEPLTEHPVTARLIPFLTNGNEIATGIDELAVDFIPNGTMNPVWRNIPQLRPMGSPDLTADVLGILDSLDETYTSLMRDVRLAKARLVATAAMLQDHGPGKGTSIDLDREVYEAVQGDPNNPILAAHQFAIRVDEHIRIGDDLMSKAIRKAGYSPWSFGLNDDGAAMTATEVEAKAARSFETRKFKSRYWRAFFQKMVPRLLAIDAAEFSGEGSKAGIEDIEITWPPAVKDTDLVRAQTVQAWDAAKAVSLDTKVRYLHSDWDEDRVTEEIEKIKEEQAANAPADPFAIGEEGNEPPAEEPANPNADPNEPDPNANGGRPASNVSRSPVPPGPPAR